MSLTIRLDENFRISRIKGNLAEAIIQKTPTGQVTRIWDKFYKMDMFTANYVENDGADTLEVEGKIKLTDYPLSKIRVHI